MDTCDKGFNKGAPAANEEAMSGRLNIPTQDMAKAETALLERAADWMLDLETTPDNQHLRRDLATWLAADVRHQQAWQRVRDTWRLLGDMPVHREQWPARRVAEGTPLAPPPRRQALGVLALAAAMLLVLIPPALQMWSADYQTGTGETRTLSLSDGSRVTLGADSAIDEDFSNEKRQIQLLRGEAYFEVTGDRRPFIVQLGNLETRDIGTAFSVQAGEPLFAVAVSEGEVRVTNRTPGSESSSHRLLAGDQITVDRNSGEVKRYRLPPDRVALWRQGRLFVQDRPVADLVNTLERHTPGYILVLDEALAQHRITGSYDLANVDGALSAIVQPWGGRVLQITPFLKVLLGPE